MVRTAAAVAALCAVAALSVACSATPTPTGPAPITTTVSAPRTASATPTPSARPTAPATPAEAGLAFTVAGDNPVTPNGSQDTTAATSDATCDRAELKADQSLGAGIAGGFALEGFPAASDLLTHFLGGSGSEIDYRLGSTVSDQARASAGFQTVNDIVQGEIALQLKAGRHPG